MKLLFVGDVHMADSSPSKRDENYRADIFRKLEEIVEIARKSKVDLVVFAGDIFHHKPPRKTTHRTVQQLIALMESFGVPVYICVGNHDITEGRLESLEKQPLGVVATAENVTLMPSHIQDFNNAAHGGPVLQTKNTTFHSVPGVPGITVADYSCDTMVSTKYNVLVSHQSIVPDLKKLPPVLQDKPFMHDSAEVAQHGNFDVVLYGHEHGNHGVYKRKRPTGKDTVFVNLGSICRGTIGDDDLKKEPSVFLLDLGDEKVSGKKIKLKNVRPAEECFLLEEHFADVEHKADVQDAVSSLKDTRLERFSVEGIMKSIEIRDDVTDDVRSTALELLDTVA